MGGGTPLSNNLHHLDTMTEEFDQDFMQMYEEEEEEEEAEGVLLPHLVSSAVPSQSEMKMEIDDIVRDAFLTGINNDGHNINLEDISSSPPLPQKRLYKLMEVRSDVQDLCFVEKVLLHKQQIIALCTALLSAAGADGNVMRKDDDDDVLQFLMNAKSSVEVVGYYGDKQVMQQLLRQKVGIHDELLHRGTLEPGLYACLLYPVLHIFLWLPLSEDQLKEASRKDLACNFIRYIMDLCSTVHICIPEFILPTLEVVAMSSNMKATRSQRTHRLQISRVKASEDDITISPGFSVPLRLDDGICGTNFLLSEGSSRCALLFSSKCMERPPSVQKVENTMVGHLPKLLEQWKSSYDMDYTRLSDEEFLVLLKHADPGSFQKYEEMHKCFQDKIEQHRKNACYSKLPSDCTNELASLFHQTLLDSWQSMQQLRNEYCHAAAETEGNTCPERCIVQGFLPAHLQSNFSMLEEKFLIQWTNQGSISGRLGLVFEGSSVQIVKAGTADKAVFPEYQDCGFNIVSSSSGICKKAPLKLGQWICLTHKDKTLYHVTFTACPGCFPNGVLLAGVTFRMKVNSSTIPVQLIMLQGHSSAPGLLLWIDWLCQKKFGWFRKHNALKFNAACEDYYLSLPNYILKENLIPMLEQKHKFEVIIEVEKLVAEQKRSEAEFLDCLRQTMGVQTGQESTLSIVDIKVKRKAKSRISAIISWAVVQQEDELVLTVQNDFVPREFLLWKAVELVPMSNDMKEKMQHSSVDEQQKLLTPKASPESQFAVKVDSGNEKLLKCILLKLAEVLFFIQNIGSSSVTIRRHPRLGCASNMDSKSIAMIRRGCDIIAFNGSSRTVAFYDKLFSTAKVYRFDETFRHCDWTGVEITLNKYSGSCCILWMELIPGKREVDTVIGPE